MKLLLLYKDIVIAEFVYGVTEIRGYSKAEVEEEIRSRLTNISLDENSWSSWSDTP